MSEMIVIDPAKIDWKLLREQKLMFLHIAMRTDKEELMGLIHLIDDIQDQAVDKCGVPSSDVFF